MAKKYMFTQVLLLDDLVGRPAKINSSAYGDHRRIAVSANGTLGADYGLSSLTTVVNMSFRRQYGHEKNGDVPGTSKHIFVISQPGALTLKSYGILGTRSHSLITVI